MNVTETKFPTSNISRIPG